MSTSPDPIPCLHVIHSHPPSIALSPIHGQDSLLSSHPTAPAADSRPFQPNKSPPITRPCNHGQFFKPQSLLSRQREWEAKRFERSESSQRTTEQNSRKRERRTEKREREVLESRPLILLHLQSNSSIARSLSSRSLDRRLLSLLSSFLSLFLPLDLGLRVSWFRCWFFCVGLESIYRSCYVYNTMRLNVDLIGFVEVSRLSLMLFGIHLMYDGNVGFFRRRFVKCLGFY